MKRPSKKVVPTKSAPSKPNKTAAKSKKPRQLARCLDLTGMNPARARVAIAQDVIAAIRANLLLARHHGYVNCSGSDCTSSMDRDYRSGSDCSSTPELRALVAAGLRPYVCAVGALLVATAARIDRFPVDIQLSKVNTHIYIDGFAMVNYLSQFFDRKQLQLIESAYERAVYSDAYGIGMICASTPPGAAEAERACKFLPDKKRAGERMIAIMKNIIDHAGTFVP